MNNQQTNLLVGSDRGFGVLRHDAALKGRDMSRPKKAATCRRTPNRNAGLREDSATLSGAKKILKKKVDRQNVFCYCGFLMSFERKPLSLIQEVGME